MQVKEPASQSMARNDPLLVPFLEAENEIETERTLTILLETAAPIILRAGEQRPSIALDREDVSSATRTQLIRQLMALRGGDRLEPIRDFRAYVARVTFSSWAEYLRERKPQHAMLFNRLRYLLENRTAFRGFTLWEDEDTGRKMAGLTEWSPKTSLEITPRLQWLLADPVAAAREIFGRRYWQRDNLGQIVTTILRWLNGPIDLRDLVFVLAELLEISDRTEEFQESNEPADNFSHASPADEAIWREYLRWLWQQLPSLTTKQCIAFLLPSNLLRELEEAGVASIRMLAPRFEISPERLAEWWNRLPFDDLAVARELKCSRQQVINLRRVARDYLAEAWQRFGKEAGNKSSAFSSLIK